MNMKLLDGNSDGDNQISTTMNNGEHNDVASRIGSGFATATVTATPTATDTVKNTNTIIAPTAAAVAETSRASSSESVPAVAVSASTSASSSVASMSCASANSCQVDRAFALASSASSCPATITPESASSSPMTAVKSQPQSLPQPPPQPRPSSSTRNVPKDYYLVTIPPGPLGVRIATVNEVPPTEVVVVKKTAASSALMVGDVIVSIQMTAVTSTQRCVQILNHGVGRDSNRVAIVERAVHLADSARLMRAHPSIVPKKVIGANGNAYYTYGDDDNDDATSIPVKKTPTSSGSGTPMTKSGKGKGGKGSSKKRLDLAKNVKAKKAKSTNAKDKKKAKDVKTKKAAAAAKKKKKTPTPSKKKEKVIKLPHVPLYEDDMPKPGYLCPNRAYYICHNNDTFSSIAKLIGLDDWKQLAMTEFNVDRYGRQGAQARFLTNSIIRIPTHLCSKWKMDKLVDDEKEKMEVMAVCSKCHEVEKKDDEECYGNPMLMCDGCDLTIHLHCAGLKSVPEGDWLCHGCIDVLQARKERHRQEEEKGLLTVDGRRSLGANLPDLEELDSATKELSSLAWDRFLVLMSARQRFFLDKVNDMQGKRMLRLEFAALMGEKQLPFETKRYFEGRNHDRPRFLGVVRPNDADVEALNMLREPIELVCVIPTQGDARRHEIDISSDAEYYLFGTAYLFCPERNDYLPMNLSHRTSIRNAQRQLISMLLRDPRNKSIQVTKIHTPSSVSVRGTVTEDPGMVAKCFDLSQLVRDCNYPIQDQPSAPTPKPLADNGLVLRDYQKASLQWMIDKENSSTGLGTAGELWARMRPLDPTGECYYYSHLTGTITKDIFKYSTDVDQKDAAGSCGNFPTGGILGEEMGLGKTVIAISLVVASPPPKYNRILPREYIASINHPSYIVPPTPVGYTSTNAKHVLASNATIVIAPMTLCSQWQSEIQRFAPFMSIMTLHNDENPTVEEIASQDMIVVSTFLLQNKSSSLLGKLRRIHFHRIFLDESHYNNTGERIKLSMASLSATHRYCVTGTPVGHSLQDLYGQLRFLRVPQFCRPEFWKHNVEKAYSDRNYDGLQVLRSLLSHLIIRHSKEQTFDSGRSLLTLPPRTMETLLLPFGSDAEKKVYENIEHRNLQRFMDLRSESPSTVLGKYFELMGMMYTSRQACAHPSLVNLDSMQTLAENIKCERHVTKSSKAAATEREKNCNATRADILEEAVKKAKLSAKIRMRRMVLRFQEGEVDLVECPVCFEPTSEKDIAMTPCAHTFCSECILSVLSNVSSTRGSQGKCPECRESFLREHLTFLGDAKEAGERGVVQEEGTKPGMKEASTEANINGFCLSTKDILSSVTGASDERAVCEVLNDSERRTQRAFCHLLPPEFLDAWNTSLTAVGTKIARLLEEIKIMMLKNDESKCVVFSQFLGTLDIASEEMRARGVKFVRVDGSMKQHQRADSIESFTTDVNTRVLLLSMRAGAAGLNLMAANHCFLMDASMNSAVEEQAIDRIHRIGQTRPVIVKRFIIKDTIEERILSNRRAISADQPNASTHLDGTISLIEEERMMNRPQKRPRHGDESELDNLTFHRLERLEALFGCSATFCVSKA